MLFRSRILESVVIDKAYVDPVSGMLGTVSCVCEFDMVLTQFVDAYRD